MSHSIAQGISPNQPKPHGSGTVSRPGSGTPGGPAVGGKPVGMSKGQLNFRHGQFEKAQEALKGCPAYPGAGEARQPIDRADRLQHLINPGGGGRPYYSAAQMTAHGLAGPARR